MSRTGPAPPLTRKARFILTITDGVDPYNGSTSVMNQGSPYVDDAIEQAQRAGVAVYAIYFGDAGIEGGMADNSGQNYLSQMTHATGGISYWEGVGNPVSTRPFLQQFQRSIAESYIATFSAPAMGNDPGGLVNVKFEIVKPPKPPKSRVKAPKVPTVKTTIHAPEKSAPATWNKPSLGYCHPQITLPAANLCGSGEFLRRIRSIGSAVSDVLSPLIHRYSKTKTKKPCILLMASRRTS